MFDFESEEQRNYRQRKELADKLRPLVKGKTILIVDDDGMREDYASALRKLGAREVVTARNGDEAIDHFGKFSRANRRVDLMMTDLAFATGMGGGHMMDSLRRGRLDEQVHILDEEGHTVRYARTLPVVINSSGPERFRFEGAKHCYVCIRGRENPLVAIGRALEDVEKNIAPKDSKDFAEPSIKRMTPREYADLTEPPRSKSALFREAREKHQKRINEGNDGHDGGHSGR